MSQELFQRRAVRLKLAELLREPLERVANDTRLRKLGRYDIGVARDLLRVFGLELSDEQLRSLERVKDLLEAAENAPRLARLPASAGPSAASGRSPLEDLMMETPAALETPAVAAPPGPPAPGTYECAALYQAERSGAATVYCSDGRLGEQIDEFLDESLALPPHYDRVACPGGPVALAGRLLAFWECRSVEDQLRFLVRAHGLRKVVLIAHQDCAYYRDRLALAAAQIEAEQLRDLDTAAACLARMSPELEIRSFFARQALDRIRFEPRG